MTNLSTLYSKHAFSHDANLSFLATASDLDDQLENLQELLLPISLTLKIVKRAFIVLAIFLGLYSIGALVIVRHFLRAHVVYSEQWKTFVEFPVIHHACHVVRKFYSVSVMLNLCFFGILGFVLHADGINSVIGMFISGILAIVAAVYSAIVAWFVQVYQIMISLEIFNGLENKDEQLMGPELEARKMKKKKIIRNLYKIFLLRDFVVIPAFVVYDSYQAFIAVQSGKSISVLGSVVTMVVGMLTTTSIYLAVPLSMAFYLVNKMRNPEIRKKSKSSPTDHFLSSYPHFGFCNDQPRHQLHFLLLRCHIFQRKPVQKPLSLLNLHFQFILSAIQLFGLMLPVSIMLATLIFSQKIEKEQVSMSANLCKVEPLAIVNDMEKPPIQTSY